MKAITVIGSGNAFHYSGRAHACYLLEPDQNSRVILDSGASSLFRFRQMNYNLDSIDGCLITHFHGDHIAGLPFLLLDQKYIQNRQRPFLIAGPSGIQTQVESLLELMYPNIEIDYQIIYTEINPDSSIDTFCNMKVEAFPINHKEESLGYRMTGPSGKTLFFSGDTACDEALKDAMGSSDLAIVELSLFEKSKAAHVSLEEVQEVRKTWNAKRVMYTHIYDELAKETEKWIFQNDLPDLVAYDGFRVELDK